MFLHFFLFFIFFFCIFFIPLFRNSQNEIWLKSYESQESHFFSRFVTTFLNFFTKKCKPLWNFMGLLLILSTIRQSLHLFGYMRSKICDIFFFLSLGTWKFFYFEFGYIFFNYHSISVDIFFLSINNQHIPDCFFLLGFQHILNFYFFFSGTSKFSYLSFQFQIWIRYKIIIW